VRSFVKYAVPRTRCSEAALIHILEEIRLKRDQKLGKDERIRLQLERAREQRELQSYVLSAVAQDICKLEIKKLADGSVKFLGEQHEIEPASKQIERSNTQWIRGRSSASKFIFDSGVIHSDCVPVLTRR
jgi:hypothetical protein